MLMGGWCMFKWLLVCSIALGAPIAIAADELPQQSTEVRIEPTVLDPAKAAVLCAKDGLGFRIFGSATEASVDEKFGERHVIDYATLLVSQAGLQYVAEAYRAWSKRLSIPCGRYSIEIEAGFYNANPNGMMGAAPEFPRIAVSSEKFQVVGWTDMIPCESASNPDTELTLSLQGRWIAKDRETAVGVIKQRCKSWALAETPKTLRFRVPSLQKALETHRKRE